MNILLIKREELIIPSKDSVLMPDDSIFIFGEKKYLPKITTIFSKKQ